MTLRRPGGELAGRPLHFVWLCDCSGSMTLDGKMSALNQAIRQALPAMQQVADDNPNARLLLRTLRFAQHASFVQPEPIAISKFTWDDLEAEAPVSEFSAEFRSRLAREGAQSGTVTISLMWNNYNDLDLHVFCPSGEEVYFCRKRSSCGGVLDVDMNVTPSSEKPVENIYWPTGQAPLGRYKVQVKHYRQHDRAGCSGPTPFTVAVKLPGSVKEIPSVVNSGELKTVHEFDLTQAMVADDPGNTAMGAALTLLSRSVSTAVMPAQGLPPVAVLVSDGQPTDDFDRGLQDLMAQPWGTKMVRIAIAMGADADLEVLRKFIGPGGIPPLQANNPESLAQYIRWASTAVVKSASSPPSQIAAAAAPATNVPIAAPIIPQAAISANDVW